jgi:hypothetical protein
MMRAILLVFVVLSIIACNNEGSRTDNKMDSIRLKFDSSADRAWDSTKAKAREIKERVEGSFNKDSAINH